MKDLQIFIYETSTHQFLVKIVKNSIMTYKSNVDFYAKLYL